MQGLLVLLSGPSGVGKNTIIDELRQLKPDLYEYSISATTRTPRGNEKDGVEYYFISKSMFLQWIEDDKFLEWAMYNEHHYGTPRKPIIDRVSKGKVMLTEIEVKGALQVMQTDMKPFSIFVMPPDKNALLSRLKSRATDNPASIKKRLEIAEWEMLQADKFDETVVNDELIETVKTIDNIILNQLKIEEG
ncbi:MAG: guanylate kinase [Planctomycetes bacterium]|nr:guanylate kinase [Planctomycetota bacterium]